MNQFLPFIVIGLATGAVYGLAGMGLVLTYKTSGMFNFGYGAVAALVAFAFYSRGSTLAWGAPRSFGWSSRRSWAAVGVDGQDAERASETIKVVATVGFILIAAASGRSGIPVNPPTFPNFFPQSTVGMLGVNVTWEQIILFVFSAVAAASLYWFFRSFRLGVVMRGVVDSPNWCR